MRLGAILYPLCQNDDVDSYKNALEKYKESLTELLPKMMEIAKSEMELKEEHYGVVDQEWLTLKKSPQCVEIFFTIYKHLRMY